MISSRSTRNTNYEPPTVLRITFGARFLRFRMNDNETDSGRKTQNERISRWRRVFEKHARGTPMRGVSYVGRRKHANRLRRRRRQPQKRIFSRREAIGEQRDYRRTTAFPVRARRRHGFPARTTHTIGRSRRYDERRGPTPKTRRP